MYDRFKELGIPVEMTRETDITLSPKERTSKVQSFFGDGKDVIVISNHLNAGGGDGAETIYALRNKSTLARKILEEIAKEGQSKPTCISNQYADQLIYRAIENKKIIIITRFEKYWLERIENLEEYENLYILLNHQIATVKEGNIIEYKKYKDLKSNSWSDLLNKVKH